MSLPTRKGEKVMATQNVQPQPPERSPSKVQDLPGCIKYILLLFLILLLLAEIYSGEFRRFPDWGSLTWIILLIKLLLIAILIWLIRVQRDLKCEITAPKNCVKEQSDIPTGKVFVKVKGTASGGVFGHYTLEVNQDGDPPILGIVTYPPGGGGVPVNNGDLGEINTASLVDGAYTVKLTVFPAGSGTPKVCTVTFNLLKVLVLINKVGRIPTMTMAPVPDNKNPFDQAAELRKNYAAVPPPDNKLVSVGGSMSIDGVAYIYGCADRKITKYEIRYARVMVPGGEPPQPATLAPIPATWPIAQRIELLEYVSADYYKPWTRIGLAPRNLMNSWDTVTFLGTTYFILNDENKWNSVGSGRFSLLLTAEDSIGAIFHDIQHIWLDNEPVFAQITAIENVKPCAELTLSQFAGVNMKVLGIAWDRLIDAAFPATAPNDNFDQYKVTLFKQGGGSHVVPLAAPNSRVINPMRNTGADPIAAEAGTLADFDIVAVLDAGAVGSDPAVNIPRNTGCAYYFFLEVWDKTRLNDDTAVHYRWDIWPFCIVNDMK
jgi:hypothetical protein